MESLRVLIVDDEEDLASTLAERLELRKFVARIATSGAEALEMVRGEEFNVVVADVKMPGIGGLDLMAAIQRHNPALPVILFSGYSSLADTEEGLQHGAFDYVMKPINIEALIAKIRDAAMSEEGPRP